MPSHARPMQKFCWCLCATRKPSEQPYSTKKPVEQPYSSSFRRTLGVGHLPNEGKVVRLLTTARFLFKQSKKLHRTSALGLHHQCRAQFSAAQGNDSESALGLRSCPGSPCSSRGQSHALASCQHSICHMLPDQVLHHISFCLDHQKNKQASLGFVETWNFSYTKFDASALNLPRPAT